jgi:hypothetical protein
MTQTPQGRLKVTQDCIPGYLQPSLRDSIENGILTQTLGRVAFASLYARTYPRATFSAACSAQSFARRLFQTCYAGLSPSSGA